MRKSDNLSEKRILYVHNARFDLQSANTLQVHQMCEALSTFCDVNLISFFDLSRKTSYKMIRAYGVGFPYLLRSIFLFLIAVFHKADVIYTRDMFSGLLLRLFGKKVWYELHEIRDSAFWQSMFWSFANSFTGIFVISKGLQDILVRHGVNSNILPDGVDLDTQIEMMALDKPAVVYTGSLQGWKGVDTLLEASDKIKGHLYIVGGKRHEIPLLRAKYPHVTFTGFVSHTVAKSYQKSADVLVLPNSGKTAISSIYTSPLKLFEYMSMQKPIVASDLGSIREIVSENEVIFFEPDNVTSLAHAIDTAIENSQTKRINASFRLVKKYTWKNRAKEAIKYLFG